MPTETETLYSKALRTSHGSASLLQLEDNITLVIDLYSPRRSPDGSGALAPGYVGPQKLIVTRHQLPLIQELIADFLAANNKAE